MNILAAALLCMIPAVDENLGPGDHERLLQIGDMHRSYIVHVPPKYDPKKPTPLVVALHGAGTNGRMMAGFSGLSTKSDEAGFVVVYPNGTGAAGLLLTWNSGGFRRVASASTADDVGYIGTVLDDLAKCVNVDAKRVYVTGMSNGGMMCYRLAAELSDRIAAIAPVAGTLAIENYHPKRQVPIIHFHGTADKLVAFDGPQGDSTQYLGFKSVPETIRIVSLFNECSQQPETTELPDLAHDDTQVSRKVYASKKRDKDVVLYVIRGGGHTWPGRQPAVRFIGKSTEQIKANDLIWEFFEQHPMSK